MFLVEAETSEEGVACAEHDEEGANFLLKDDDKGEEADIDEAAHDGGEHAHIEGTYDEPEDEEGQDAHDDAGRHSATYKFVNEVHKVGTYEDIDNVYKSYV